MSVFVCGICVRVSVCMCGEGVVCGICVRVSVCMCVGGVVCGICMCQCQG